MPLGTFTVASAVADYYADPGVEFSVLVVAAAATPDAPIRCLRDVVSGEHDAGGTVLHAVVDAVRKLAQLEVERIAAVVIPDASNTLSGPAFVVRARLDDTSQVNSAHWASLDELSTDAPGSVWLSHPQSISILYSNEGIVFKNADDAFPVRLLVFVVAASLSRCRFQLASGCRIVRMPDGPMNEANIAKCFALMDEAVEWLVSIGRADQWGDVPWSKSERLSKFMRETCARDDLFGWFIEVRRLPSLVDIPMLTRSVFTLGCKDGRMPRRAHRWLRCAGLCQHVPRERAAGVHRGPGDV